MSATIEERHRALRASAEAFVEILQERISRLEREGHVLEANRLKVLCLLPWEAALRIDDAGDT